MEVEPQVCARGVDEEEEETEVEEVTSLIRKHKSKYGILNGERNDDVPVFQSEIEKGEGGEDLGKPMVYFEAEESIWKCRHCVWTFRMGTPEVDSVKIHPRVDHIQIHNGHSHGVMIEHTLSKKKLFSGLQIKGGNKSSNRKVGAFTSHNGHKMDRTTVEEIVESLPITDLINKDSERSEIDFEAALREQNTHDLYCPNCNSCITRRVILRKRKRTVVEHSGDAKREKVVDLSAIPNDNHEQQSADAEPEVFGCLQCLCIFIRTATGYELLSKMFQGRDGDKITSKDLRLQENTISTSNKDNVPANNQSMNCLAFLLEWGKREAKVNDPEKNVAAMDAQVPQNRTKQNKENKIMALDESSMLPVQEAQQIVVSEEKVETLSDLHVLKDKSVASIGSQAPTYQEKQENQKEIIVLDEPDMLSVQQSHQVLVAVEKLEPVSDSLGPEGGARHEDRNGVMVLEKSEVVNLQHPQQIDVASYRNVGPADSNSISVNDGTDITKHSNKHSGDDGVAVAKTTDYGFEEVGDSGKVLQDKSATTSSKTYIIVPENKDGILISSTTKALPVLPDEKVCKMPIISHETRVDIGSQVCEVTEANITSQGAFVTDRWDILKSIVYGGLTESITSLGVTSSAAGGDASTLSIVALGLANLISGLFIIAHNILELKHDNVRYTETIGQPHNFWRNAIIVIVSYVLFGSVAPITYGFSFRENDNKDDKLIAVAIASLFCVFILALGKARVTDKSYIKRVVHYSAIGIAVSGISYIVGVYAKKLLDQLGWISGNQNVLYRPSLITEASGRTSQNWVS